MNETYERSGMTLFKEVDGKLVVVANFEHGMDDDMQQLLDNQAINAELLESLELLVGEDGDLFSDEAHSKAREAIRKAQP